MTADATLAPGSAVVIVCEHGEALARATVLRFVGAAACDCGGPLYRCRFVDGPLAGEAHDLCGDSLRRPN